MILFFKVKVRIGFSFRHLVVLVRVWVRGRKKAWCQRILAKMVAAVGPKHHHSEWHIWWAWNFKWTFWNDIRVRLIIMITFKSVGPFWTTIETWWRKNPFSCTLFYIIIISASSKGQHYKQAKDLTHYKSNFSSGTFGPAWISVIHLI